MKVLIRRETVRANPHAGETEFHIPGKRTVNADGSIRFDVCTLHSYTADPDFLYDHEDPVLECRYCHIASPSSAYDDDYEYGHVERICPHCKASDAIDELEYEELPHTELRKLAEQNVSQVP